jgi:hypothetical protein
MCWLLQIESEPRIFNLADTSLFPNLEESLKAMLDQLERCQKVRPCTCSCRGYARFLISAV